mmetsp:Transcript_59434/g.70848  ORF Transcript_59434/g.70848 Transcript_59434/m.70848 type:complete len:106 (-) Transcript_59434:130-447(-)
MADHNKAIEQYMEYENENKKLLRELMENKKLLGLASNANTAVRLQEEKKKAGQIAITVGVAFIERCFGGTFIMAEIVLSQHVKIRIHGEGRYVIMPACERFSSDS